MLYDDCDDSKNDFKLQRCMRKTWFYNNKQIGGTDSVKIVHSKTTSPDSQVFNAIIKGFLLHGLVPSFLFLIIWIFFNNQIHFLPVLEIRSGISKYVKLVHKCSISKLSSSTKREV